MTAKINRMRASRIYDIPRAILGLLWISQTLKNLLKVFSNPQEYHLNYQKHLENSGTGTEHESVTKNYMDSSQLTTY